MAIAISSFTPTSADSAGGTQIVITGTQLDLIDEVLCGNSPAQIVSQTTTTLTFRAPAHVPGDVKISVTDIGTDVTVTSTGNLTYAGESPAAPAETTGAAKWTFQVDLSDAMDGSGYTTLFGLTDFKHAFTATTQDTSRYEDFDLATKMAWKSQSVFAGMWTCTPQFDRIKNSGVYDAAQQALLAAHDKGGDTNIIRCRWFDRTGGSEAYEGFGMVQWEEAGGQTDAKSTVTATITGDGPRFVITNPAA